MVLLPLTISNNIFSSQKKKTGMNVNSLEERIVELETRQAFQEHAIEELDGVIITQQQQIDRLEIRLVRMQKQLAELIDDESREPGINGP